MTHSQKSIRDPARNRTHLNVDNEAISRQLENLFKPYIDNQFRTGYQGNQILDRGLVEIRRDRHWHRYLTSVLDPNILPPYVVADLYYRRWRVEESFLVTQALN